MYPSDVGSIIFLSGFGIILVTGYLLLAKLNLFEITYFNRFVNMRFL